MAENLHSIALVSFLPRIKVIAHIFIVIIVIIVVGVFIFEIVIIVIGFVAATYRGFLATIDRRRPSSVSGTFTAPEVHIRVILVRIRGVYVTITVCYRYIAIEEILTTGV